MTTSFDALLPPLLDHLEQVGLGAASADRLREAASHLPPIWRGGFEVHLDGPVSECRVDLHQAIVSAHDEPHRLTRFLRSRSIDGDGWTALQRLAAWWRRSSLAGRTVLDTMWIEVDTDRSPPEPSVFLTLAESGRALGADAQAVAVEIARMVPGRGYHAGVRRCLEASEAAGATVTHLGFMLGRSSPTLRVNVKAQVAGSVERVLEALEWPGDVAAAVALAERLGTRADGLTLAVDVAGDTLAPHLGLELFVQPVGETRPQWRRLLDALVDEGLCRDRHRDALLQAASVLTPPTSTVDWPDPLVVDALLDPEARFSALVLQLHHVKVTWAPERTTAKGYLRFDHAWLDGPPQRASPAHRAAQVAAETTPTRSEAAFRHEATTYYDQATGDYLDSLGPTFQAYLLKSGDHEDPRRSNVLLARRAGIEAGMRVLDLGCGVCGPALDIATAIPGVRVDGVTISPVQVEVARGRIEAAGMSDWVSVTQGDYHELPFAADTYDRAYIFEAVGYSPTPERLFEQVFRVLRPGGALYLKDIFAPDRALTPREAEDLALFDRIYAHSSASAATISRALSRVGFEVSEVTDLSAVSGGDHWQRAHRGTALGRRHNAPLPHLPLYVAELTARKPDV